MRWIVVLSILSLFVESGKARQTSQYLSKYDYLNGAGKRSDQYKAALKRLQEEAGLTVTGRFDDETRQIVSRPRCGNSDGSFEAEDTHFSRSRSRQRRDNGGNNRWNTHRLTFDIQNKPRNLSHQQVRRALRKALGIWSSVSGLDFNELGRRQSGNRRHRRAVADLNIGFREKKHECGNARAFDGPGGELAHAFFPTAGQAHFDMEEKWALRDRDGYNNLVVVATHEVGHMLGLGHSDVRGSIMNAWYNDPAERDQFSKTKRHVKLNWDDIRAIQDLYDGPKSSKTRHDNKREHLRGEYTGAITLSATRILLIQDKMAITRLPGGALTPKRPLDESFDQLDGPIVSAAYSSHLNLFYFFKDTGVMYIYSGSGGKDTHLTTTYHRVNLRQVPVAMFVRDERLWAITRTGSIHLAPLSKRPHFLFYARVRHQFPSAPAKINGAFTDARGGIFLIGSDNHVWRYVMNGTNFELDHCYPKKITQSLLPC